MTGITAHLSAAKEIISNAISNMTALLASMSESVGSTLPGAGPPTPADIENAEDRLLDALENGDDTLYDTLINPETGVPYTEAEKYDALQNALNREIAALESLPKPLSHEYAARLRELNETLERVERNDIIHTLATNGIDVSEYPDLVDRLGDPAVADAFVALHGSEVPVEANTAQAILDGHVDVFNINDETIRIETDPDGRRWRVVAHPEKGEYRIPYTYLGLYEGGTDNIWILDSSPNGSDRSSESIEWTLIHEANHVANPFPDDYRDLPDNEQARHRYEMEFTAYWVSGRYDDVPEATRDDAIRDHILGGRATWLADLDTSAGSADRTAIEAIEEPDPTRFNLDNSFPEDDEGS